MLVASYCGLRIRPNLVAYSILGPSINGMGCWCHHPCHLPCHSQVSYHVIAHVISHVNIHVIIAIHIIAKSTATSFVMSSMCDMEIESVTKIILFVTFNFCHRKWAWVGFWGPRDILWRFRNVMDQAIYDENLRNVTRCDLWCSIHDAIWDRHRYNFMTVF